MANRAGGSSAAVMVMALLAAMLIVGAEAGRHHRHHRHRDSPPAPPGYNEPMAAPSPYFRGEPSPSPAYSPDGFSLPQTFDPSEGPGPAAEGPEAAGPEAAGPEGYHARRLSDSFAYSPFAFGEGPAPQLPEAGC